MSKSISEAAHGPEGGAVSEQDRGDRLGFHQFCGDAEDTGIKPGREDNALGVAAQDFDHGREKGVGWVEEGTGGRGHAEPGGRMKPAGTGDVGAVE